jgi:acyl-CoA thioesterase I
MEHPMQRRNVLAIAVAAIGLAFHSGIAPAAVIPRLQRGERLNIVALGTSLTAPCPGNWFAQFGDWLSKHYPGQATLSNRAVAGTTSRNLPEFNRPHGGFWQLEQALANDTPDAIFIEFAINDAYKGFHISAADSRQDLRTMIQRITTWAAEHKKNVDIIVQTMNNTGPSYASLENDLGPYYRGWREEAAANNAMVIDHYRHWMALYESQPDHAVWKTYVPDDLHPNALGASKVIVPEVIRALKQQADTEAVPRNK